MTASRPDRAAGAAAAGPVFGARYQTRRRLKAGPSTDTWLATDLHDGRSVVVKATAAGAVPAGVRLRLEHEAEVLSRLNCDDLAPLLAVGREQTLVYVVTPFVPGVTLEEHLRGRALSVAETLLVARSLFSALVQAHAHDVLHRDIKPGNVIVDEPLSRATLIDFGLARSAALDPAVRDRPVGTALYVSPEQAGLLDRDVDERSDLYSAGILLFECLAGRPPFTGGTVGEVLRQHLSTPAPELRSLGIDVPGVLDEMLQRLLRKDPDDRYQSAGGVLADIDHIARSVGSGVREHGFVIGSSDRRMTLTEPAFVGRRGELESLEALVERARRGDGGLVLLEGDSGGGKTRLLDELSRRGAVGGAWVLHGQGLDQAALRPFQILAGVARGMISAAGNDPGAGSTIAERIGEHLPSVCDALPELGEALGETGRAPLGPEAYAEVRALDALSSLIDALGSPGRPALVLLDDCQWADELSLKLLGHWAGLATPRHVCVIVSFRSEEVDERHPLRHVDAQAHLRLEPFGDADVGHLVESMAGPVPGEAVALVQQLAGGNPFMASAVLRGLVEAEVLVEGPGGWRFESTAATEVQPSRHATAFLTRRLELLPPETLRVLSAGAVLGKEFDLGLAAHLTGQGPHEVVTALREAGRRHIVWADIETSRCAFVHDKLRESLLGRLPDGERRDLHRRAAQRIEELDADRVFELAFHFDAAGESGRALPYALAAGARARAQHSLEIAEQQFRIAARGAPDPDTRRRVAEELGEVLMLRGRYDDAGGQLHAALSLSGDNITAARIESKLGELAFKRGEVSAAGDALERALRLAGQRVPGRSPAFAVWLVWEALVQVAHTVLPRLFTGRRRHDGSGEALLAVRMYSRLTYAYWFSRGLIPCAWSHLRALNLAERYPPTPELAQTYSEHAPVMTMLPLFRRGIAYAQRSLAIRRGFGDPWGEGQSLHFYGVVLYGASRFEEAMQRCAEAARLLERTGDRWEVNTARWHIAYCLYRLGDLAGARDVARRVHAAGIEIGDAQAAGISLAIWAKASGGRVPRSLLEAELERGTEDAHTAAELLQAEAVLLVGEGRPAEAVARLEEAYRLVRQRGLRQEYVAPVLPWLATARRIEAEACPDLTPGRRRRLLRSAAAAARRARRLARWYRNNLPHAEREAGLVDAILGRPRRARRHFARSLDAADRQGARFERAQTLLARGRVGLEFGWATASADLDEADAVLRALDAALDEETADDAAGAGTDVEDEPVTLSLADRFDTVLEAGRRIATAITRQATFAAVRAAAHDLLRGERCVVLRADDDADVAGISGELGGEPDELCRQMVRNVLETGRPVVFAAGEAEDDHGDGMHRAGSGTRYGGAVRSALCAPILVRERVVAYLYASHDHVSGLFGEEEERLAGFITTLAGAALENAEGFAEVQALTRTLEHRVEERTAQLAQANLELQHQALHDSLTGLANRVLLRDRVEHALERRRREPRPLAVLLVDLDEFKTANDSLGHAAGDELLVAVGERLRRCVRPGDTVARLGGDEFAILLEDAAEADVAGATAAAQRIIDVLRTPITVAGRELVLKASVGVALADEAVDDADALFRNADAAMYAAKEHGKGRLALFEPTMLTAVVNRLELRASLERAVSGGELRLKYQPLVDLRSGRVVAVEALVRWRRPDGELTLPADFIPVAEETGVIVPLGRWVLEEACRQVVAWEASVPGDLAVNVNLSARQLQDPELPEVMAGVLEETGLAAERLVLEITESVLMRDPETVAAILARLKAIGVRLAVDDFGTGYSSLGYLRRFPVDILKIDKSFVDGVGSGPQGAALARALVHLGRTLRLEVVAEGIEDRSQEAQLAEWGCDLGQGYHWSEPLDAPAMASWLAARARVPAGPTRVLVVDDDRHLRDLFRLTLELEGGFETVAEASDGREAIDLARRLQPDLVLLDLRMPVMDGLEALPGLLDAAPGAKIAVLTALEHLEYDLGELRSVVRCFAKDADPTHVAGQLRHLVATR